VLALALALALAEWVEGNKELCREITSYDASKKSSLLQHYDSYSKLSKLGTWRRIQRLSLHSFAKFLLFIYIFLIFLFYDMKCGETKTWHGKGVNKNMVDERERCKWWKKGKK
jgi:hypothetical protein